MIEIKMTGMCEGCGHADLQLVPPYNIGGTKWSLICIHNNACVIMRKRVTDELAEKYGVDE